MDEASTAVRLGLRYRRTSLTDKTKLKDSTSRRKTFSAALQQFEEQMDAAKAVSPATRPINLYYGLAQAGLAMTAAHTPGTWTFNKHGLKILDMEAPLPDITVRPEGRGAFQAVADATGSAGTTGAVSLGALWTSIPDLMEVALDGTACAPTLDFIPDSYPSTGGPNGEAATSAPPFEYLHASVCVNEELPATPSRQEWSARFLSRYPGLQGAQCWADAEESFREIRPGRFVVELWWSCPKDNMSATEIDDFFDALAPEHRYLGHRFLRPALEPHAAPPTPLMSWWLLLYSFSMLARYQPRKWTEALDIDKSCNAAALEYALGTALTAIPHLVLEGLDRKPMLLRKPVAL